MQLADDIDTFSLCCCVWSEANVEPYTMLSEVYAYRLCCGFWVVPLEQCPFAMVNADVEAAAHFDHWQRAHLGDENVRQDLWPEALRNARVIPAVEYIQV